MSLHVFRWILSIDPLIHEYMHDPRSILNDEKKKKKKRAYRQTHTANGIDAASAGDAHDDIDRLLYAQFFFPQQIYTPICEQVKAPKM